MQDFCGRFGFGGVGGGYGAGFHAGGRFAEGVAGQGVAGGRGMACEVGYGFFYGCAHFEQGSERGGPLVLLVGRKR